MSEDDVRSRLLDAAGLVFAEKGFQTATVRDICQAANVNVAAVNYYFGDKERLYIEAVKLAHGRRIQQLPMPRWPPETPPETKLRMFIEIMLGRMLATDAEPWQSRLMMRELLQPTTATAELVEAYFRPHFELLLTILAEMLPADYPADRRRLLGYSVIGQCLHYRVAGSIVEMLTPADELATLYSPRRLAAHISEVMLAALGRHPPVAQASSGDSASVGASPPNEQSTV